MWKKGKFFMFFTRNYNDFTSFNKKPEVPILKKKKKTGPNEFVGGQKCQA